ncbi:endolytic transglycosylase MltG [Candidatus Roizmanbacteria bacterium]|nr:endolytic transglycosylase MltG [Candidatus Roizmanbacteria bacterium]
MKKILFFILFFGVVLFSFYWYLLGPVNNSSEIKIFTVPQYQAGFDVIKELKDRGFIKNTNAFEFLMNVIAPGKKIESGGFRLSGNMSAQDVLHKITNRPDLVWVTFGGCLRKEQIGEILAEALKWSDDDLNKWNTIYTNSKPEYKEGVYYPDTYLLPIDESGEQIAGRLIARFNEKFAPLSQKYIDGNIKWTTGLKIASLIAREAAGQEDMRLISGIIWNRLDIGMPLQIDATMQYTRGKDKSGRWWGSIDIKEKQNDSPYNSYLHKGLPPTPICSPNIDYMRAVLNPDETPCIFYLHDGNKTIHCAKTYEGHVENIKRYLN